MAKKNTCCSFCGQPFVPETPFPRTCASCQRITYVNPIPVGVLLLPVDGGLLTIRRAIEPAKGKLAIPGGYVDLGETWQAACARELWEETGIRLSADEVKLFDVHSSTIGDGVMLIFGVASPRRASELPAFTPTHETSECVIIPQAQEMAFPLHTQVVRDFFARTK